MEDDLPERTCIVTREQKPDNELIRFVLSPDGKVVPDLKRKLPGRGCWVSKNRQTLIEAMARKAFARALGEKAEADAALPDRIASLMRRDMVAALSFCRKAGLATSGFTKVEDALAKGHVRALLHAASAAADGSAKLDRKAGPNVVVIGAFSVAEMDLAFGRENVIHAALLAGGQTEKLLDLAQGLAQYENLKS
jgi:predicted RNA-binding protein YlxR (DUF448 family)